MTDEEKRILTKAFWDAITIEKIGLALFFPSVKLRDDWKERAEVGNEDTTIKNTLL